MLCGISGEAPQVPVATKNGTVYEKRLLESYISENGTDPLTGEPLTTDDLIQLKTSRLVRPRPPTMTSIPSLLSIFQEEWDSLALETYKLKQNLTQTRQELSLALYQHDAAVRVIARLTRERDEARAALSNIDVSARGGTTNGDAMQVDSGALPEAIIAKVETTQEKLGKSRRKRPVPEDWASADDISSYTPVFTSEPFHPGASTIAMQQGGDLVLVGGSDGIAAIYSLSQGQGVQTLKGGGGAITSGLWAGSKAVVSTSAGRVKVFEGQKTVSSFDAHAGEVTAISLHPSGDILASVGVDKSYVLYDLDANSVLTQVYCDSAFTCAQFHPDGHLLAAGGADGEIKIFEIKSGTQAATFEVGAPLKDLFFSENGTWLAVVTQDSSSVSIWDIRKSAEIKSLETGGRVDSISWDYTGQFLLAGGPGGVTVEHYSKAAKSWSELMKSAVPAKGVAWGEAVHSILVLGEDGVITTLGTKA